MERYAVIVAGGKGMRMGSDIPKQFLPVGGKPLLMHTLANFHSFSKDLHLILTLPPAQQDYWRELCRIHDFTIPHLIVDGGDTRFGSVLNGLNTISSTDDNSLVAVHDGVRPFVSHKVIAACFDEALISGAAIPAVPVVETVRQLDDNGCSTDNSFGSGNGNSSHTIDRSRLRLVQTPQTFRLSLLRQAYQQPYNDSFTDDASVVEAMGHPISLVEGNRENIKITTPGDLLIAETLCRAARDERV